MAKVQVEPRPLSEPLPGGSDGAHVVVEPMVSGSVRWARSLMERPEGRLEKLKLLRALLAKGDYRVPCPAFLVRHPTAGAIVVDTGLHPSISSDPVQNFGRLGVRIADPQLPPGEDVPARLRSKGLEPSQIPVVVMTHLHYDHASAISEFPQSAIVVSRAEWQDAANEGRPATRGYRHAHFDFAFNFRTVDFDRSEINSHSTFGRSFDLFGDGSVRLLYTPGHSAGHMSVLCRLNGRSFLIGGDSHYYEGQLEGSSPLPPTPFDEHRLKRSLQELRLFRKSHPKAIITPGHDPEFYERLEERYE